ncbi:DUF2635 domain-containing protein [Pseudomonas sp. Marseille-Q5115]|uniref:DUF2635 domain-containing protein n=1 Tax=Pseudomonas sp. Marseille-Q5115 TaxID=2866593 RepID=UPI001CE43A0E|nr:DUF2635 domain-containing protein [Pseudomonas sp. Marseille-Q5115]
MNRITVVPAKGRAVPDPETGELLPAEGRDVPDDTYWRRRLLDGDVVTPTPTAKEATTK